MSTPGFHLSNRAHARKTLRLSKAKGVTLFLFDREATATNPVSFIFHQQVEAVALNAYSSALHTQDPLLPRASSPQSRHRQFTGINPYNKSLDTPRNIGDTSPYWRYFSTLGYQEAAASYKAVSRNLYLVIGLHTTQKETHIDIDAAGQHLENWLDEANDYLVDSALRKTWGAAKEPGQEAKREVQSSLFTRREFQVVGELIKGQSNKQIAYALGLSEFAVQNHLRRLYRKFSVHSRTELIARLLALDIL